MGEFFFYKEVISSFEAVKWIEGINSEYKFLVDNGIWEFVDFFAGRKLVICKWVFKKKLNVDGSVVRYKVRLVVRGYS